MGVDQFGRAAFHPDGVALAKRLHRNRPLHVEVDPVDADYLRCAPVSAGAGDMIEMRGVVQREGIGRRSR